MTTTRSFRAPLGALSLAAALLLGGCASPDGDANTRDTAAAAAAGQPSANPAPAAPGAPGTAGTADTGGMPGAPGDTTAADTRPRATLALEVDLNARQLHVLRGGTRVASHPVAVGSSEWPTRTGEWTVDEVIFNPEWVPPDEEWARDQERKAPGASDNPLGHAQIVYDRPRSIHGTNEPSSIGQAVSHGSIRVRNEVAVELARMIMEETGAGRDEGWYRQARTNRSEQRVVEPPQAVRVRVY